MRLRYETVTSTSDLAREWVLAGHSGPALITASHQTKGRGRRGAEWVDRPGASALMTFVAEMHLPIADAWQLSFAASLAAQRACARLTEHDIGLEWPNDLSALGRKLGGTLVETVTVGNRWTALIGIGINVGELDAAAGIAFPAAPISICELAPSRIGVEDVIGAVNREITLLLEAAGSVGWWDSVIDPWCMALITGGEQAGIGSGGTAVSGVLTGIDRRTGEGLVRTGDGRIAAVRPAGR